MANQLALKDAVHRYDIRKAFTFHRTVANAKAFVDDQWGGLSSHLPEAGRFHVSGRMSMALRQALFRDFVQADAAIMSNARCLTEGVNVPTVDLVAFMTPKRSRIDIVQAVGRALRKSEGKTCGYILVPVYVNGAEDVEAAMRRTDFDHVWEVLQALQEQDSCLAESIATMREAVGRGVSLNDSRFAERVEILAPEVHLDLLRRSITTKCVEALGSGWDERYGQLKAFHEQNGNCLVLQRRDEDSGLAAWVGTQRMNRKKGTLLPERERKLSQLGFEWDPITAAWDTRFGELEAYKAKHGHCEVPHRWAENPILGGWVAAQRRFHRQGRLDATRTKRLEALGLVWDPAEAAWPNRMQELRTFATKHGHCDVPQKRGATRGLGSWVNGQRQLKRKGKLPAGRIKELEAVGLRWNPAKDEGEQLFAALVSFHGQHGHCEVPAGYHHNPRLRAWTHTLRQQKKTGQITPERLAQLDQLGFIWNTIEAKWDSSFAALKAYAKKHGHTEVPQTDPANPKLALWVVNQRQLKRKGKLTAERIKRLESLGFEWQPHESTWDERHDGLMRLKEQGQPWNPPKNKQLAKWLKHQRCFLRAGSLPAERATRLLELLRSETNEQR